MDRNRFKRATRALVWATGSLVALSAWAGQGEVTFRAHWIASVDADGRAQALDLQSRLPPALAKDLEREIRSWQFRPARRDGAPVASQTTLYLSMTAVPDGEGRSRIRFDDAFTGARMAHLSPPKYPESALAGQREGLALVWARFDATGQVIAAEPAHSALPVAPVLMKSAIAAVKRSRFAPEVVGDQAVAGEAVVPFCFHIGPGTACKRPHTEGAARDGEDVASIDPAVQLATEVRGRGLAAPP